MKLSNKNIDVAVEDTKNFFEQIDAPQKDLMKISLVMEESLLRCQNYFGATYEFEIYQKKWFGVPKIVIRIKGDPFNPLRNEFEDDDTIISNEIMQKLLHCDVAGTIYRYENGFNELIFFSTKERKLIKIPGGSMMVAIILAIICSFVAGYLPQDIQNILVGDIVTPLLSTLMGLIVTFTVFMMFFSIVSSICAIENVTTLENIGATVIRRFFLLDLIIIAFTMAVSEIFFPVISIGGGGSLEIGKIIELLLSIIPTNILESFLKANILQVTVMAFLAGIGITIAGNLVANLKNWIIDLNTVVFKVTELVFKVIPLTIFLCIFKTLSENNFAEFFSVWKLVSAGLIALVTIAVIMLIWLSLKSKISVADFLRKISPPFFIALATSSTIASLPKNLEVAKTDLNVDEKFCSFWIPLSVALLSPSIIVKVVTAAFFATATAGETLSIMQLLTVVFLAIQLGIASPKVAGGITASYGILLTQLGLPLELLGSLMIANVIIGNIFAALNVVINSCELIFVSRKMNFIKTI